MKVETKAAKFYDELIKRQEGDDVVVNKRNKKLFRWQDTYSSVAGGNYGG